MDGTLITTKSQRRFPIDQNDWKFLPNVVSTLQRLHDEGTVSWSHLSELNHIFVVKQDLD
jgi:histidinol phosphatase-like enzyme